MTIVDDEDESGPEPTGIICRVWPTGCAHPHLCQDACFDDDIVRERGDTDLERLETARQATRLLNENLRLREALADIARGDYSDPLCQRARDALAHKP